jgi:hypothetical protein
LALIWDWFVMLARKQCSTKSPLSHCRVPTDVTAITKYLIWVQCDGDHGAIESGELRVAMPAMCMVRAG